MPEETVATPPVSVSPVSADGTPATPPVTTPAFELSKCFNNDGTPKEGYIQELVPEELRGQIVYSKCSNIKDAYKQLGELNRMISKKGVIIPDPKTALPSEIDAFHRALGRPDKPENYKIEFTEDLKDFYEPKTIEQFKGVAHKLGLNPYQAQEIMNLKMELDKADIEFMQQDEIREKQETETALRNKWGSAYDTRLHLANYMVENNTEGEQKAAILERIGNDPVVADFLATIAKKFVESGGLKDVEMTNAMTPGEAESQMKEKIVEHQAHAKWKWDNPAGYKREEEEIDQLAKIAASGGK